MPISPQLRAAILKYAKEKGSAYVRGKATEAASYAAKVLLGKDSPVTPAKALADTGMKKYLDRTYQKKCGVEVKQLVTAGAISPTTTIALGYQPFVDLPTGELSSERTGDSIEIKDVKLRMVLTNSSTTVPTFVRLMWVWVRNYNGSSVSVSQILNTTTNLISPYTIDEGRGVQVLRDKTIALGVSTSDTSRKLVNFGLSNAKHFKSCKAVRWTRASLTGSNTDLLEGFLALYVMAADATITGIVYYANAEFVDV